MNRITIFIYGLGCYLVGAFAYFIGLSSFLGNFGVIRSIDIGVETPFLQALLTNLGLILLFGLPHSLMARQGFKQWWTKIVPPAAERSTYMLQSGLLTLFLIWQWRPMPASLWQIDNAAVSVVLWTIFGLGWGIALTATFLIDHFELTGLQQVYAHLRGKAIPTSQLRTPFLYKVVRHPLQFGVLLTFWATPQMTVGRLVFAVGMTLYILIGLYFEERDLVRHFGEAYREYQKRTPMLIPIPYRVIPPQTDQAALSDGQL
jgi:protein-S-isoprenylcysteine O-methyltransferase Ste14